VSLFLGDDGPSVEALVRAIDYTVELVGPEHVGLGLDYVFDLEEPNAWLQEHRDVFPGDGGYGDRPLAFLSPRASPTWPE